MAAAGVAVSVSMGVLKPVLEKLATLLGNKYKKFKRVRDEVSFLVKELGEMKALLEDMDNAEGELNLQAKKWRKDIIDMSYVIEDCIDNFMDCVGDADDKVGILKKASHYLRTIKDRYRIANQISEIKTRVIKARNRRDRYKLNVCTSSSTEKVAVDPRLSALYKDSTTLVGIDTQKVDLVKWVNDEEKQLKVISIVGFGGLGKTTLANEVYCEVKGNFNSMAFVPISQKPDISRLLSSVCSKLGLSPSSHACEVQELIDTLREYLHNKRYLIVLDDLWEVIHWNIISCAFPKNNQQSRLIVTTRIEGVALACRIDHGRIHYMEPLSDMDSRLLFFTRIFGTENTCSPQFTGISSEILKRCGGLPLAIVTMASTLVDQPIEQWEYIKHSIVTESAANSLVDMMHILDLSYKNLPQHLRACFLYLGIYPEDYSIQRDQLIELLVAERIVISRSPGQDARDVAQSYLNELVNKNMIQPTDYGYSVHDMMLDLILKKCREANFVSVVHSANIVVEQKGRVHRLSVSLSDADDDTILQVATNCCQSQVRSLVSFGASKWMPPLPKLKSLRVLYLEFPEHLMRMELTGVGQLSQLRYLKVRAWSRSECSIVLPSGIWRLQHLERLEIYNIPVCITPSDIVDLPCLSHLILSEDTILPDMIGKMKALRILSSFVLAENLAENIRSLGELNKLEVLKLKWLRQTGDNTPTTTWMDALIFSLEKLSNLKTFWLQSHSIAVGADALLLLSPPFQNIEVLLLDGLIFSGVLPRWIRGLQKLRVLSLGVKQMPQEDIDIIGTLPCLIHLRLWIPGVPTGRIVIGGTTGFNALEKLDFNCDVASYLIFEVGAMPSLRELSLFLDSHKWDKVTPRGLQYLSSLKYITVWMVFFDENTVWMVPSYSNEVTEDKNSDARSLISRVFQEAADAHPSHPAFNIWKVGPWARPSDVGLSSASRLTFLPRKGMEAAISSSLGAMGPVLRKLDLLLAPEFRLRKRVKDGIGILKEDLEEVSFVLVDLSMLESPSARAKCWMEEARELSYQVEDFVDEMMLMCTDAGAKIRAVIRHRVGRLKIALLPALPRRSTRVAKIAQLRTLVWQATERLERYQLGACCSSQNHMNKITQHHWHHRPPALYGDAANLVGIEATRMTLIEMLTGKAEQQLKVVSIAGPAGVGKTTLAKEIFREVRGQFELRAFVHSSRKIDMRRLLGTIISQVHQHHQQPSVTGSVQSLIDTIQEQLQDKRYLIVIDDLWEETAWDIVRGAFPEGNNCSRIVATTENMNVALKCCSYMAHNILKIKPLGIQDSGYLFFNQVFGSEQQCPDKLKEVSYGIIRKCCGLPLSLIHVAGLLASIDYSELWYHVHDRLCSIINRSHTVEEIQKKILNLSYNSLPHCLKTCLLYFNMYPEGYIMWKVHLVKQWTAEGFIDAAEGKDRQEIADGYFDELVNRGMIQPMKIDYNDEVLSCTVHHIIFDLIKYNSKEEEFIAAIDYSQPITGLSSKAHRLSYQFSSAKYAKQPARITMSQLRSLGFFGFIKCMPLIVEFKHLRVLVLDFWGSHDGHMSLNLSRICILFQLRYLKISGDIMVELPAQMQGLHYLETLDIDAGLSAVPVDIVHLPRLLHLGLQAVTKLPDGIGHIRSLSTLLYFDLRCNSEDNIRSLGQLTNLRHLHLTCSAVLSSDHLKRRLIPLAFSLGKLGNLKSLTLTPDALTKAILFDISSGISSPSIFLQRLELLPPICFFSRLPTWFGELHKLRILKVVVKELQGNDIKNISGLPSLIVFSLYVQTALTGTISFSTMAFPALKYFKFTCGVTSLAFQAGAMPSLRRLKICFNAHRDENHGRMLDGIEHLVNLQEVSGQIGALPGGDEYDRRAVKLSLEDTIRKHPRCLRFNLQLVDFIEEEYPPLDKLPQRQHDEHEIAEKDCSEDASSRTSTAISPGMKLKIKSWIRGALLGSGSFGMVYEAITDEGLFFAVKEVSLLDQGSKAQQSIFALEQEIALLSQFQHENIVQYYGTDKEESTFYIFVELVTQGSLSSLYQKYILRESEVSAYTRQILNGLVYLHELNVVHRDIRCANILVHANGSVKLADFGLGKITGINSLRSSKSSVYWMAPEVINPKMKYGHPADIWSLGCTVLEMLTGQIPFPDVEWTKALFIIGRGGQPHIPSNLSREAQDFIHQCVRVDPETRPSASQLLEHPFVNRTQIQKKVLAPSSHILPVAPPPEASMTANLDDVEL